MQILFKCTWNIHQSSYHQEKQTTNAGEHAEKKEPYTLLVGMQISAANMEISMEVP
jgi:hypothetical protein